MTVAPQLEWIRPTHQARSRATLDRLLDAAEALLAEKAWEDVGVADIALRADSSVGAFYSRFRDKDGLLNALHERFMSEAEATAEEMLDPQRWSKASVSEIVQDIIAFRVRIYSEHVGLIKAFALRTVTDRGFAARAQRYARQLNEGFVALMITRRRELLHPEPANAAEFVGRLITSLLTHRLLFDDVVDAGRPWSKSQITTELTHTCLAYLGVFPESALDM